MAKRPGRGPEKVPTVRDVAREAGVSAMTVSNVINGRVGKVSKATIERVRAAMANQGFVLNAPASALSSDRSKIIALVYPVNLEPLANQHDAAFVGAVEREVSGGNRHLMIWAAKDATDFARTAANLRTWRIGGVIFYGTFGSEVDDLHQELDVPLVFVDNYSESPDVNRVGANDYRGGFLAACHLFEKGHRSLGFVGPPVHDPGVVHQRYLGFTDATRNAGERVKIDRYECDPRFQDGLDLAAALSAKPDRPTGLFATADTIAIGLLKGFVRNGIDVPGQVSLIGFDDIPEASHGLLELTTIRQDINKKAHVAVETLVRLITAGPDPRGPVMLEVDLVERDTVGPPPSTLMVRDAGSGSRVVDGG